MQPPGLIRSHPVEKSTLPFPVVGIGASAGGIPALTRFFEQFTEPCGMAFVVILHLSPRHDSSVAAILQRVTVLNVLQVTERTPIQSDHVYVIPPTAELQMADGHLWLRKSERKGGVQFVIDLFFRTLAEAHGDRAFAIVLSGLGSDGAVGVRRVNECGGVTIAQLPFDAQHDSMPRAAIATGLVDLVLPVAEIPARLRTLWKNVQEIRLPAGADLQHVGTTVSEGTEARDAERAFRKTLALLQQRTRHDFRNYKRATVLRRLERRLQVNAVPDLTAYVDYLDRHPAETGALLQDMLISVTNFFRDPEAFQLLQHTVIPRLFEDRGSTDTIRVWVAGCATGEEAYSIAMLLHEEADRHPTPPPIQIFATDIDERGIGIARLGIYPAGIASDVSVERLRRFFHQEDDRYRVSKALRESVLFAVHNLLRDPPFSRIDIVSCRNLLIYLDQEAQQIILGTFRNTLRPNGHLILGASESTGSVGNAFQPLNKRQRIFELNPGAPPARKVVMPVPQPVALAIHDARVVPERKPGSNVERHRWALEQTAPPSVLIDARQQILHMSLGASPFFIRAGGVPSHELIANTRPELRAEMQAAIYRAQMTRQPAAVRAAWTGQDGVVRTVMINVYPFRDDESASEFSLITLHESEQARAVTAESGTRSSTDEDVQQLETEVRQLKADLRDTIDQTVTSTEELTASNEELQAMNEELRSASEELETSKEELQSINEELTTVNYELKMKVDETVQINDDLQNLITSTDIAVIFVDANMRIKRFTPRATELFNVLPTDVGRSLLDITHRLHLEIVTGDAEEAFRTLQPLEREVHSVDGRQYLARVIPYRTAENKIEGAVMTFVDITSRLVAETKVSEREERLRIVAESVRDYAIIALDDGGRITGWNVGARETFRYEEAEVLGKRFDLLFTVEDRAAGLPQKELDVARNNGTVEDERWHLRKDGTRFFASGVTSSYTAGGVVGFAKIARDVTGTKMLDTRRDEELNRQKQASLAAESASRLKDEFLAVMSHELKHPLNLIHVNAELLARIPEVERLPAVKRAAQNIRRTVAGQARIIDDLLDLSRARTGKMTMTLVHASMRDIVARIVEAARRDAHAKGIDYHWAIDPDNPLVVACDPVRVEQIVWNLLSNAIKFTGGGGEVSVRLMQREGEAILEVTDSGRGIEPAALPHVFTMFHQERRETTNGEGGMGIGLALVRELTKAQGGRVDVRSPGVDKGATFVVALPLVEDPVVAVEQAPSVEPGGDARVLAGLRVLIVDDSEEALQPFAELLRLEGSDVVQSASSADALERLEQDSFDLLISDIGMPKMDGYELINEVRQRAASADLVAIAMSGYGRPGDVQRASEVGFDAHLTKPASIDDYKRIVGLLLRSGRLKPPERDR